MREYAYNQYNIKDVCAFIEENPNKGGWDLFELVIIMSASFAIWLIANAPSSAHVYCLHHAQSLWKAVLIPMVVMVMVVVVVVVAMVMVKERVRLPKRMNFRKNSIWPVPLLLNFAKICCNFLEKRPKKALYKGPKSAS